MNHIYKPQSITWCDALISDSEPQEFLGCKLLPQYSCSWTQTQNAYRLYFKPV